MAHRTDTIHNLVVESSHGNNSIMVINKKDECVLLLLYDHTRDIRNIQSKIAHKLKGIPNILYITVKVYSTDYAYLKTKYINTLPVVLLFSNGYLTNTYILNNIADVSLDNIIQSAKHLISTNPYIAGNNNNQHYHYNNNNNNNNNNNGSTPRKYISLDQNVLKYLT